jgi:hypothetical protein
MTRTSIVYAHPAIYQAVMRVLYRRAFEARYLALSALIEDGAEVFEACAGDGYLYTRYLAKRPVRYRGGDLNARFVAHARRRSIPIEQLDITTAELPRADVVVLQASLYQFMPDHRRVVDKLLGAARRRLLIAEPVRNLASHAPRPIAWLAQRATDPGDGHKPLRFDEPSLDAFFHESYRGRIEHSALIPGGREKIYCLRATP